MRFEITFLVEPAALFGLPESGTTVLPVSEGPRDTFSDTFTRTAAKIGHGTLSRFRSEDEQINVAFALDETRAHVNDNYLTVSIDANSPLSAYEHAAARMEALLAHLALDARQPFTLQAVYFCDETGQPYPPPRYVELMRTTEYNLETLKESINTAVHASSLHDQRLERAMHYFEHALVLNHNRQRLARPGTAHFQTMMAAILLNLWKAVTSIIGEAGTDRDYQRRYREYGIDRDFVENEIQTLKRLRDNYDVAHYTLDALAAGELEEKYGEALSTTIETIKKYREHIQANATGQA